MNKQTEKRDGYIDTNTIRERGRKRISDGHVIDRYESTKEWMSEIDVGS